MTTQHMVYPIGITCQELVELVTDYVEGALENDMRGRFEQHLVACPGCNEYVEQMRLTIRTTGQLREDRLVCNPPTNDHLFDWLRSRARSTSPAVRSRRHPE